MAESTILVVEDEPIVRMLVVDFLSELGYAILEAKDANVALPILRSDQPIDLLLTDVGLPGMDGRQLAEAARGLRPGLKVLFATGYAEGAGRRNDFVVTGTDLVSKPFDLDHLAEKVAQLIVKRQ
jgi:CheY-like chemotaxis protein